MCRAEALPKHGEDRVDRRPVGCLALVQGQAIDRQVRRRDQRVRMPGPERLDTCGVSPSRECPCLPALIRRGQDTGEDDPGREGEGIARSESSAEPLICPLYVL